jgi:methyl-accepting chemotaxis protein
MSWFRDMRIAFKLTGTFLVMVALSAGMGLYAVSALSALNSSTDQLAVAWLPSVRHVTAIRAALAQYRLQEIQHIVALQPGDKQHFEETRQRYFSEAERALEIYSREVTSEDQRRDLGTLKDAW